MNVYGFGRCCCCGATDDRVRSESHWDYPFCDPCATARDRASALVHTPQACEVARQTGWDVDAFAIDHGWSGCAIGPVGQHRDSGALDRSNYEVILRDLREQFPDSVAEAGFGHWGVGWVDEIVSDAGHVEVQAAIWRWIEALDNCPVADDEHFSDLEYVEALETIRACASTYWREDCGHYGLVTFEKCDDLPDDWARRVFSELFDAGEDTSPDGMRGESIDRAMIYCGFATPETD